MSNLSNLKEMTMGTTSTKAGKKLEWINHPSIGHSVTMNGAPLHTGFLDHKSAARLYSKHMSEGVKQKMIGAAALIAALAVASNAPGIAHVPNPETEKNRPTLLKILQKTKADKIAAKSQQ